MKYKVVVEYEYPVEHKTPVKAELILHGDRVETWNIKPLEQEPKTGHWIDDSGDNALCSCCYRFNRLHGDYCKWCGAKMVEPQESEVEE